METQLVTQQENVRPNPSQIFMPIGNMRLVSLISWLLLLITSLVSFAKPDSRKSTDYSLPSIFQIFWLSLSLKLDGKTNYLPAFVYHGFFCFCFYSLIAFIFLSCLIMFYNTFFELENIQGMFERGSKFHFIPLLCTSALFIIGECLNIKDNDFELTDIEFSFNLIFTFIGIVSLFFIQLNTDLSSSKALQLVIKHGTYGILMALLVYNFFFPIFLYIIKQKEVEDKEKVFSDCGLAFSILIGICNLALTFFLKNIGTGITNLFLYIGMIIWFFKVPEKNRKDYNGLADGIIDCVIVAINLGILGYLIIMKRNEIL